eukprot:11645429-Alexandrium_andersonii.AAC.1
MGRLGQFHAKGLGRASSELAPSFPRSIRPDSALAGIILKRGGAFDILPGSLDALHMFFSHREGACRRRRCR